MIKKTITYTDIDGNKCTEDFYFNLTKAEILELEVSRHGGFAESMKAIVASENKADILATIKEILLAAYGERSAESRHFVKTPESAAAFSHTEAYSVLFMELFQGSEESAAEFFSQLLPEDLRSAATARTAPQDHKKIAAKKAVTKKA